MKHLLLVLALPLACALCVVPATDPRISFSGGRIQRVPTDGSVRFDWPCVTLRVSVNATAVPASSIVQVGALMDGAGNRFQATMEHLNGTVVSTSVISTRKRNTTVAIAHVPGGAAVTVLLRKLTSAQDDGHVPGVLAQGVVHFYGIALNTPGARLESSSSSSSKRRLEFFGASDTAGFGVDGYPDPGKLTCLTHMPRYENCAEAYSAELARRTGAELHLQAIAGKGLLRNAVNLLPSGPTIPQLLNRSIATDAGSDAAWDFTSWVPDAVVLSVGGNDYNNPEKPSEAEFAAGYASMLKALLSYYSAAPRVPVLVSVCGGGSPSDPSRNRACPFVRNASDAFQRAQPSSKVAYIEIPVGVVPDGFSGCLGHHNATGQSLVASYLEPKLRKILNW